ncbi:DNA mismatch repair protein MutS-like N-terminal [Arabidopsis suecica]|uniref:DNA mismatch repair protein MutS-like N-terminal n=1 Tax=Arabidopsis suecica TaxID=45249 RepID=A0A8T2FAA4_ARASU|nr:DNA mismatch repair protein MutS-like N-terminal [Arabidopsis suecica]
MHWIATRNAVVSFPKWRFFFRSSYRTYSSLKPSSPILLNRRYSEGISCLRDGKSLKRITTASKKVKTSSDVLTHKDLSHLVWWKERLQTCKKPSTLQLIERLMYTNLLGLDPSLRNGSLKDGNLNWEMLQFKSRFPREVLLCRVGEFYEAIGIDACILVEYAGLNPFGGLRSDSIPKAGCPIMNLRQTLDDLTRNGYSVCIVEEVQGPTPARSRKGRFISGHAHPGSPYVYGLVGVDHDLDFPDPMPVVGISRSARGYCMISIFETMKAYSLDDGLTEEALVTKLRTRRCHHLFLHASLRHNASGTCRWGEFGEGGLLWGECSSRNFEWFEGDTLSELLSRVKDVYGLDDEVSFRNVNVPSKNRPRPLHLGTATQIGALPTEGIPCLLKVLLPSTCSGLPSLYVRDLLLNPPAYDIALKIQETCKLMSTVTCSIPEFTCVSSAKLVKLLEQREANYIEFCRIKNVLDDVLHMHRHAELVEILKLLMDPTWVATGLKIDFDTFVNECHWASDTIGEMISLDENESHQNVSKCDNVPNEFFYDMESSWRGRVKGIHIEEEITQVEKSAEALSLAVAEDFHPIISRIKATTASLGGPKGEIAYAREHESVWFKGKRFTPSIWAGTAGEDQIKQLKPALDSKGKKVGEEWFTTPKVEIALVRYHEASENAKARVLELLRELSVKLQTKINVLVFASMLLVISKALFSHACEGRRRKWVFPTLVGFSLDEGAKPLDGASRMKLTGLSPYWFDVSSGTAVHNTVDMQSLFLLTGPNGGGKSSLLRSICAAALLGISGLMVPAESACIPHFDSIMLHMKSYDSPVDGKSSFQVEMSEIRSIVSQATSRSLVLIDEICRGTETAKGTCIAGSVVESLDTSGCLGIVSTHLHGIFSLPLTAKNITYKAMGAENVEGQTKPTWKLTDGVCRESLAFETAKREGVPESVIQRAEALYLSVYAKDASAEVVKPDQIITSSNNDQQIQKPVSSERSLEKDLAKAIVKICGKKMIEPEAIECLSIGARELPPPSTVGSSCVYVMRRPDKRLYIGQTDDLEGRIRAHRAKEGLQGSSFLYLMVQGKSMACQLETLLINQLHEQGYSLANLADGKHRNFGTSSSLSTSDVVSIL